MINPLSVYEDAGRKTADAVKKHDSLNAVFYHNWFRKAVYLEDEKDKPICRQTFDDAYRKEYKGVWILP